MRHGPRAEGRGPDERPVRRQGRGRPAQRLRARGQPAGQPHGAVRLQGDRHAAGQGGGQGDGRRVRWPSRATTDEPIPAHVSVKETVFPFVKFAGVDIVLGPEMKSTGEVMGISERFSIAFAKSQLAAGTVLPQRGQDLPQRGRSRQGAHGRPGRAAGADWASSCWPPGARPSCSKQAGIQVQRRQEDPGRPSQPARLHASTATCSWS